jgi:hypothetical protein
MGREAGFASCTVIPTRNPVVCGVLKLTVA